MTTRDAKSGPVDTWSLANAKARLSEVVEAMDKPAADIDDPAAEPTSTVTRLR